MGVKRVVSGAQTGVDRAALDVAIELGIAHGGWVPRGRLAEDGRVSERYQMREADSDRYPARTELNVRDSDGTLIFTLGSFDGGTALTARLARQYGRPLMIAGEGDVSPRAVAEWIIEFRIETLNVAGPRESKSPGIYERATEFLREVLAGVPASDAAR